MATVPGNNVPSVAIGLNHFMSNFLNNLCLPVLQTFTAVNLCDTNRIKNMKSIISPIQIILSVFTGN